jgi:arylsulfatase A-like enzyme
LAGLEQIDRSIGVLLAGLEEMGQAENTLVFFVSDNGGIDERLDFKNLSYLPSQMPQFSPDVREYDNKPLRNGKGSIYEGGVRVPFIVRWPGHIKKGQVVGTPVHIVDIAATLLDVAGAEPQHPMDGASLVGLFETGNAGWLRGRAIFQYCPFYDLRWGLTPCASIRKGDYKLIVFFGDRVDRENRYVPGYHIELYDLHEDIAETINLAESRSSTAAVLQGELFSWMRQLGAAIPSDNPHYDPKKAFGETREKPPWLGVV